MQRLSMNVQKEGQAQFRKQWNRTQPVPSKRTDLMILGRECKWLNLHRINHYAELSMLYVRCRT